MREKNNTFQEIADTLNKVGIPSRFGGKWHKTSVCVWPTENDLE